MLKRAWHKCVRVLVCPICWHSIWLGVRVLGKIVFLASRMGDVWDEDFCLDGFRVYVRINYFSVCLTIRHFSPETCLMFVRHAFWKAWSAPCLVLWIAFDSVAAAVRAVDTANRSPTICMGVLWGASKKDCFIDCINSSLFYYFYWKPKTCIIW